MAHLATRKGVPVGFWRSVGHSHNAFFSESSVDEIAFELKQDPLALRRQLLVQAPRYLGRAGAGGQPGLVGQPPAAGAGQGHCTA